MAVCELEDLPLNQRFMIDAISQFSWKAKEWGGLRPDVHFR